MLQVIRLTILTYGWQLDSGNNYSAVHVVGHGSTYGMMAMQVNQSHRMAQVMLTLIVLMQVMQLGEPIRTAGYNAHGFRMQGNTTSTNTVTQPLADSQANYNHRSVSSCRRHSFRN